MSDIPLERRIRRMVPEILRRYSTPVTALVLGVIVPVACLLLDPVVFRSGRLGVAWLGEWWIEFYGLILLSTSAMLVWHLFRRFPSLFCGLLAAGSVVAVVLGIMMLPMTILGLFFAGVGILGLAPFFTAVAFCGCARRAHDQAGASFRPGVALFGFVLLVLVPVAAQAGVTQVVDQSIAALETGSDAERAEAVQHLRTLGVMFDPDVLVWRFDETQQLERREHLAAAYRDLTGDEIEFRQAFLDD